MAPMHALLVAAIFLFGALAFESARANERRKFVYLEEVSTYSSSSHEIAPVEYTTINSHSSATVSGASSRPNAVSLEILGRGILYGLAYDRLVTDIVGLGIGYSRMDSSSSSSDLNVSFVPVYFNLYTSGRQHRGFFSGGLTFLQAEVTFKDPSASRVTIFADENEMTPSHTSASAVFPTVGGGYEYRGGRGFLFRAAAYGFVLASRVLPWGGLSFGVAF